MEVLDDIKGKEVLSGDGRLMGKLIDFTYDSEFKIDEIVIKMNKDVIDELGEDKPWLSSLKLGIGVSHVKAFTDNIVLKEPIEELYLHFEDVSEKKVASSFMGMEISGNQGNDVGKVEDILIDTESMGILSMMVKINKDILETLDLKKSLLSKTRLGISMEHVKNIGDMIMLDTSIDDMGKIIMEEPIKKL
ncbi:MAG: PRC-barrel domain-containing protein [Candidatus Saliniplasma sp.]